MANSLSSTENYIEHYEIKVQQYTEKIAKKTLECQYLLGISWNNILEIRKSELTSLKDTLKFLQGKLDYYKSL